MDAADRKALRRKSTLRKVVFETVRNYQRRCPSHEHIRYKMDLDEVHRRIVHDMHRRCVPDHREMLDIRTATRPLRLALIRRSEQNGRGWIARSSEAAAAGITAPCAAAESCAAPAIARDQRNVAIWRV